MGFTLVEVLVALCVFSFVVTSTGYFFRAFNGMRARERLTVESHALAMEYVEQTLLAPPPCLDTNFTLLVTRDISLFVGQTMLPGKAEMLWLSVEPVSARSATLSGPVRLGRLVYCR